ncbi:MAG: hypothetical protein CMF70_04860 [Magnetovibrio sp.]|nr:hypothetical protein [Magnetovibrio sp.]
MFSDNTLTPREATRLCALGTLSEGPLKYAELAREIRAFISYIIGPSLEVLASSIELLKYEDLIYQSKTDGDNGEEILAITEKGTKEFHLLLTAGLRPSDSDLNKLITALKFRFLNQLNRQEQTEQISLLEYTFTEQLSRLSVLHSQHSKDKGSFSIWLDREIKELEGKLLWLRKFNEELASN